MQFEEWQDLILQAIPNGEVIQTGGGNLVIATSQSNDRVNLDRVGFVDCSGGEHKTAREHWATLPASVYLAMYSR